jgi:ribokinase
MADIVVVGSLNHDLTVITPSHPRPGETVMGTSHYSGNGGKGANQSVAAARLGASVAMVGRVGDDVHGHVLREALVAEGVDIAGIGIDAATATGLAVITIDSTAENTIVVSPGANAMLAPEHIEANGRAISEARVVLAQLEVPTAAVAVAARLATGIFCLNPAPALDLSSEILGRVDVLIPNRSELGVLANVSEPGSIDEVAAAARQLQTDAAVVVTLGSEGALLVSDGEVARFPAPDVDAVDPTGAGDAFCGAIAAALSQDMDLEPAVERGVIAGALATMTPGAQASLPTTGQVENFLHC